MSAAQQPSRRKTGNASSNHGNVKAPAWAQLTRLNEHIFAPEGPAKDGPASKANTREIVLGMQPAPPVVLNNSLPQKIKPMAKNPM
jgi:hypothetical protein